MADVPFYLTYDDVLLLPQYSEILPKNVDTKTQLTKNIKLNMPLVSAAMDTVTEHELAIKIALYGGIGIIHKNLTPDGQADEVIRVKRFENGFIFSPWSLALLTYRACQVKFPALIFLISIPIRTDF